MASTTTENGSNEKPERTAGTMNEPHVRPEDGSWLSKRAGAGPSLGASPGLEERIEAHEANRLHLRDSKRKAGKRQQHSATTRVPCLRRRQDSASQLADLSTHLFQL